MAQAGEEGTRTIRERLGWALHGCGKEVSEGVLARLDESGGARTGVAVEELREAIARTDVEATQVLGRWVATGREASKEEMDRLGSLGMLIDRLSLSCLVQAYLAWRDAVVVAVEREAAALEAPESLVAEVRGMVARSCDAALVRMTRRFDAEQRRLQRELAAEQDKLAHMALHDSLTGLANRRLLSERLDEALRSAGGDGAGVAVCFVDLDRFKAVNDAFGHEVGDRVLRSLALRLRAITTPADTAARVGGDEFVVLWTCLGSDRGKVLARGERILASVREPYLVAGREIHVSASLGIALASPRDDIERILARADAAMYRAKGRGGSGCDLAEFDHAEEQQENNGHERGDEQRACAAETVGEEDEHRPLRTR